MPPADVLIAAHPRHAAVIREFTHR
jgi:hypothetical protein